MCEIPLTVQSFFLETVTRDGKDIRRYVKPGEIEVGTSPHGLFIRVKSFEVEEHEIHYCQDCLKNGEKKEHSCWSTRWGYFCKDHWALLIRREEPEKACPKCDKGYLTIEDDWGYRKYCSHCDFKEERPLKFPSLEVKAVV